jgi:hypothetical protein
LENDPKSQLKNKETKERRIQAWAIHLERMKRIDDWTSEEIREVIEFSQRDTFWNTVILSAEALRKNRDKLRRKMQEQKKGAMSRAEQRTATNLRNLGLAQN